MIHLLRATSKLLYWNSKLVVKAEKLTIPKRSRLLGKNGIHNRVTSFSIELWPWNTTKTWLLYSQSIHNVNNNTEMYLLCILFIGRADTFLAIHSHACTYSLLTRVVFKLVWDFSVAPYKPSDSAQKFDGPLNLVSHEREVRWWIVNPSSIIVFVLCLVTQPLWLVRPDLEVHQISAQNHSVCTELRKSFVLIWKCL